MKDKEPRTTNQEPRFFPTLLRYQGEMRQWRLVRHFFLSQVESDN